MKESKREREKQLEEAIQTVLNFLAEEWEGHDYEIEYVERVLAKAIGVKMRAFGE